MALRGEVERADASMPRLVLAQCSESVRSLKKGWAVFVGQVRWFPTEKAARSFLGKRKEKRRGAAR